MEMLMNEKATGFTTPLEGALWCAKNGMKVFPLRRNGDINNQKAPVISDWENKASDNPVQLATWESEFPGSNWAVACGPSGLVVVDTDLKKGKDGHANLVNLEMEHGEVPPTLCVRTASGNSLHRYYTGSSRSSNSTLAPGVDVKSCGGYVVAPGSIFRDAEGKSLGQYCIENESAIAAVPGWIANANPPRKEVAAPVDQTIPDGKRDQELTSIAGSMRHRGLEFDEIFAALSVVNARRCKPPVEEAALVRICRSVCRYEPGSAKQIEAALALEAAAPPPQAAGLVPCASDIDAENMPLRPWVAPGRYLRGAMSLTVGPGGASKSSFALLEGIAISLGRADIAGMKYKQEPRTVWYYNAEDPKAEIERRILGICIRHNISAKSLTRFFYSSGVDGNPLRIAATDQHGRVVLNRPALDYIQSQIQRTSAELVILDPWAGIHSCDENANIEIDQLARQLIRIATESGVALHVIHHSRKLGTAEGNGDAEITRGASSLVAAARYACTLRGMSERDGTKFGIPEEARHRYCRLDDAKMNYSEASDHATWFLRENVALLTTPEGAPAQGVAVLVPQDIEQIRATESHSREVLGQFLGDYDGDEVTVLALSKLIAASAETLDQFGGGSGTTIRRRILATLREPLELGGGKVAVMTDVEGTALITIEQEFLA